MTTTIKSLLSNREVRVTADGDRVHIAIASESTPALWVELAEFLAAVATELNVITIPRSDLPKVTSGDDVINSDGERAFANARADRQRDIARARLALAEYLDANPPIDEAQVDALATLLKDDAQFGLGRPDADEIARRLVQAGVRAPKEADK